MTIPSSLSRRASSDTVEDVCDLNGAREQFQGLS
jgi:hypothetical protein